MKNLQPREPQRSIRIAFITLVFTTTVAAAIALSAYVPALRFLSLGYDIPPIAGLYVGACGVALLLVARQVR
ncbi:MAG: hypothetical protein M3R49_10130 [Chloroflexota bacterium]|nr:hypothetical protein [Chloroflexota bacterium]